LHHAAAYGDRSCIELLLNAGSNVNSTDEKGWTPLHIAVSKGNLPNVETLIRYLVISFILLE
jgi:ankyrin repeat protein